MAEPLNHLNLGKWSIYLTYLKCFTCHSTRSSLTSCCFNMSIFWERSIPTCFPYKTNMFWGLTTVKSWTKSLKRQVQLWKFNLLTHPLVTHTTTHHTQPLSFFPFACEIIWPIFSLPPTDTVAMSEDGARRFESFWIKVSRGDTKRIMVWILFRLLDQVYTHKEIARVGSGAPHAVEMLLHPNALPCEENSSSPISQTIQYGICTLRHSCLQYGPGCRPFYHSQALYR